MNTLSTIFGDTSLVKLKLYQLTEVDHNNGDLFGFDANDVLFVDGTITPTFGDIVFYERERRFFLHRFNVGKRPPGMILIGVVVGTARKIRHSAANVEQWN